MTTPSEVLYRLIPLTQGQWSIVDASDYDYLMQWKWSARWNKSTQSFYAIRNSSRAAKEGRHTVLMHRYIIGLEKSDSRKGDHKNRNTLDNRRGNLRMATNSENLQNSKTPIHNKSGYKGVSWRKNGQRWIAQIGINGKNHHIGRFHTAEEAYAAYCASAKKLHGEFGRTV